MEKIKFKIGNVEIGGKLLLAPMAGVSDLAFRHICYEMGAAMVYTEMVSAKALCRNGQTDGTYRRHRQNERHQNADYSLTSFHRNFPPFFEIFISKL